MSAVDIVKSTVNKREKRIYILNGLHCSTCGSKIETAVNELPYVENAVLNFATGKITIEAPGKNMKEMVAILQDICDRIETGIEVSIYHEGITVDGFNYKANSGKEISNNTMAREEQCKAEDREKKNIIKYYKGLITRKGKLISASIIFILALLFKTPYLSELIPFWLPFLLFISSYFIVGGSVINKAIRNISRGRVFDENFLMTIATICAFIIGEYPEAVTVMLFYMIGETFQDKAVDHSRRSIKELMDIRPDYANLKKGNNIEEVVPGQVNIGDEIIIRPGERVPLDGEIVAGNTLVDTSALTGESVPRSLGIGDQILSGMINKDGLITVRVSKNYADSTVAKILDLVENAAARKAPTEEFISKVARYYTPIIVYSALGIAIIPPLFIPGALFIDWVYRALIFLVISCPCALVVSIPLGFFAGIGRASKEGILVKGGNYLEALNKVEKIVFDKTGTLTKGVFTVNEIKTYNSFTKDEVLEMAAVAESHSNHPIGAAILSEYKGSPVPEKITDYQEIPGLGIRVFYDGREILVGNKKLLTEFNITDEELGTYKGSGTIVYVVIDKIYAGYISIKDELKEDALLAVNDLRKIGVKELIMLTGDRQPVAKEVAASLELDSYYEELLPEDKVEILEELLEVRTDRNLLFVGDGINDAPVLARADIGVAMGGVGSDAAIEAADLVLMTDEPSRIVTAIKIASLTLRVVWQNIILALGVKGIVLLMGVTGIASMWLAVFADVGVTILAVINSLRILNKRLS